MAFLDPVIVKLSLLDPIYCSPVMTADACRPFAGILLYRDLSVFDSITTPLVRQDALKSKLFLV